MSTKHHRHQQIDCERLPYDLRYTHGLTATAANTISEALNFARSHSMEPRLITMLDDLMTQTHAARVAIMKHHARHQENTNALLRTPTASKHV